MTSEATPNSFLVDFMNRTDIVRLLRATESNLVLHARVDVFVSLWELTKAEKQSSTPRGNSILKKGLDSTYNLIRSSVNSDNVGRKWREWLDKRETLLAEAEEERKVARAKTGNKKVNSKVRVQEKCHIEDVARFDEAFGTEDAVLLANLTDVKTWYAWPKPRKEIILHFLDPEYARSSQSTTSLSAKRPANGLERGSVKQVCQGTGRTIEQHPTDTAENESTLVTHESTNSIGLDHPIVRLAWTETGEPFRPIYDGQSDIVGSTDRWIQYRWSAISAMETILGSDKVPTSSDVLWLYYSLDRAKVQKLPFAELRRKIRQSQHWRQEVEKGLTKTACVRLAFPRDQLECYGPYCNMACIVSAADAPQQG
ncbi:hypothetical protein EJ07DRAFT_157660 [Lizonia empirigonia]|nr:hypothetical protein EJ07DRAFT_157660 [Lizonia empirigonia]